MHDTELVQEHHLLTDSAVTESAACYAMHACEAHFTSGLDHLKTLQTITCKPFRGSCRVWCQLRQGAAAVYITSQAVQFFPRLAASVPHNRQPLACMVILTYCHLFYVELHLCSGLDDGRLHRHPQL